LVLLGVVTLLVGGLWVGAQQGIPSDTVVVRAITPPDRPLPSERDSAGVTRFSFIVYGDTRSGPGATTGELPPDGRELQREHARVVDAMVEKARALASSPFPVRFVIQSGDAVLNGPSGAMWNVSFTPIIERLTRGAQLPFFFAVGNHDVTSRPKGDTERAHGVRNTLDAIRLLIPPDGSIRRLTGYPTYAFGYGNAFFILFDSNIVTDPVQLAWVTAQLEGVDRVRYHHVFMVFHHPPFTSGAHGGPSIEPQAQAIRDLYLPVFRKHHVRMTLCGHDHLLDHWVERYDDQGRRYRMDHVVTGGGGAPVYTYRGEQDVAAYVNANAEQHVSVEHLIKPGTTESENPHHFVVIHVDGDRLSLEAVASGSTPFLPYGRARLELFDTTTTSPVEH
jgi:hypothetical protein